MGFNLFVAKRIYNSKAGEDSFSRPAVIIATAGISVGIIVMILSVAVVFGFKREISEKVVGFGSHFQVRSHTVDENKILLPVTTDSLLDNYIKQSPGVTHTQQYAAIPGLIKTEDDFLAIHIKGVGEDYDFSFIKKYVLKGNVPSFSSTKSSNKIVISAPVANEMGLNVGSHVYVYFINEKNQNIRARKFEVSAIYQTHLEEFDRITCFTDIYTVRKLNNWDKDQSTGLEITVDEFSSIENTMDYLSVCFASNEEVRIDRRGYERGVYSIQQLSPHVFAWLDVLDMNVVMILVLMLAIGGITVIAGLLIVMLDRVQMIGILKALGATNMTIRKIFSNFAVMIVGTGILIGNLIGIGLCFIQKYCTLIHLDPSTYYIDTVPIEINWLYVFLINVGVLIISSMVIFGSSFLMSIKGPAQTMKWE